jgi:hypothetical protein
MSSVKYLQIGGENRPFRLRFKALKVFVAKTGLDIGQLANMDLNHISELIAVGLTHGYQYIGEPTIVTAEQVDNWLDEDFRPISQAMEVLSEEMKALFPESAEELAEGNAPGSPS